MGALGALVEALRLRVEDRLNVLTVMPTQAADGAAVPQNVYRDLSWQS
jgi:hypothetical protein